MSGLAHGVNFNSWLMLAEELKGHHQYKRIPMEISEGPGVSSSSPEGTVPMHFLQLDSKLFLGRTPDRRVWEEEEVQLQSLCFSWCSSGHFWDRGQAVSLAAGKIHHGCKQPCLQNSPAERDYFPFPVKASRFPGPWEAFATSLCTKGGLRTLETWMSFLKERHLVRQESYISPTLQEVIPAHPRAGPHHPSWLSQLSQAPVQSWLTRWPLGISGGGLGTHTVTPIGKFLFPSRERRGSSLRLGS